MRDAAQLVPWRIPGPGTLAARGPAAAHRRPPIRFVLPLFAVVLRSWCVEPPISEDLEIRFLQQGVVVTATTKIREDDSRKNTQALQERIERARWELSRGEDFWSRRIAATSPTAERLTWDRDDGKLSQVIHRVFLEAPRELNILLADAVSLADYTAQPDGAQLALYPLPGSRATGRQMKEVRAQLDDWSARIAVYLDASSKLYSYLKRRPDRAEVCLFPVFGPFIDDKTTPKPSEPTDEEQPLVEAVNNSISALTAIFDVPADSAYSPDELFHLVFDPFSAQVRVRTPGKIVELEGFRAESENSVVVPGAGLYGAFKSLEGRWLAPDLFVALVEQGRHGGGWTFDLASFAARERTFSSAPMASTVRDALADQLNAAPVYRVRWSTAGQAKRQEEINGWDDLPLSP